MRKCKYDQGCFFVTVGAYKHSCIFGEIRGDRFEGKVIAYWKYNSTKEINSRGGVAPPLFKNNWNYLMAGKVFQRNYYERIVRNRQERLKIESYIKFNPKVWDKDRKNPINIKEDYWDDLMSSSNFLASVLTG